MGFASNAFRIILSFLQKGVPLSFLRNRVFINFAKGGILHSIHPTKPLPETVHPVDVLIKVAEDLSEELGLEVDYPSFNKLRSMIDEEVVFVERGTQ